jgi:hypothetical protein
MTETTEMTAGEGTANESFPYPWDTPSSLFVGWASGARGTSDGHPEPLRLFREFGIQVPDGWYALRCLDLISRNASLSLLVESHPDRERERQGVVHDQFRSVWWIPSQELAQDVARQITAYERRIYLSYGGMILPLYRRARHGPGRYQVTGRVDTVGDGWNDWPTLHVEVQVYRRRGDTADLVSTARQIFLKRPVAV